MERPEWARRTGSSLTHGLPALPKGKTEWSISAFGSYLQKTIDMQAAFSLLL